jgi:hypothetical protein
MTADNINKNPASGDAIPPLPAAGEIGHHVCEIIRLYLAVLPDLSLSPEQQAIIEQHVQICAACAEEQQLLNEAEDLLASLGQSETMPSARVDQAVMAAILARAGLTGAGRGTRADMVNRTEASSAPTNHETNPTDRQLVGAELAFALSNPSALAESPTLVNPSAQVSPSTLPSPSTPVNIARRQRPRKRKRDRLFIMLSQLAVAAILLLALLATVHFATNVLAPSSAFALPANLTWNGYVLYHTQSEVDAQGETYEVQSYHEMSTGNMHVETTMPGQMDVVVVKAGQQMLGEDMMHHVAQWNPQGWMVDDSAFDLATLKSELQSHRATYLGKETFHGQSVYEIRLSNGQVLLLNMRYQPVNVLQDTTGSSATTPMYTTVQLIPAQQVPDSMWSTQIPAGFHMGELPSGPLA